MFAREETQCLAATRPDHDDDTQFSSSRAARIFYSIRSVDDVDSLVPSWPGPYDRSPNYVFVVVAYIASLWCFVVVPCIATAQYGMVKMYKHMLTVQFGVGDDGEPKPLSSPSRRSLVIESSSVYCVLQFTFTLALAVSILSSHFSVRDKSAAGEVARKTATATTNTPIYIYEANAETTHKIKHIEYSVHLSGIPASDECDVNQSIVHHICELRRGSARFLVVTAIRQTDTVSVYVSNRV